ncbi:MAG: hypothetical protein IPK26_07865 [Planctomycetes bacterium]|nr:hypothetical protein [Planctomycetota bacterium]
METTVTGVFADPQAAQRAMQMLGAAGFAQERIDRIDHDTPDYHHKVGQETSDLARGAMLGAALCAAGSAIAGAGLSAIWEFTLLHGALLGAVVGAVVGAAVGLLIGSATGHQVQEEYEHMLEGGAVLLAVNTDGAHAAKARAVLAQAGGTMLSTAVHRGHHGVRQQSA